jgi:hypothetical protein
MMVVKQENGAKTCSVVLERDWKVVGNAMNFRAMVACWTIFE